jgi:hypothetical protein
LNEIYLKFNDKVFLCFPTSLVLLTVKLLFNPPPPPVFLSLLSAVVVNTLSTIYFSLIGVDVHLFADCNDGELFEDVT